MREVVEGWPAPDPGKSVAKGAAAARGVVASRTAVAGAGSAGSAEIAGAAIGARCSVLEKHPWPSDRRVP